ncbi:hypothetical protein P1P75_31470 [Streptomyces sp. ID05-39B]|uniref:hypothetical protein n=1 Tax=Streptomyces sp. ID05-39B TaxID=3028664 RepID=UPI0029BB154D|nr:hypothetical protein [Streptomyces sp. ID05-39B]MDX3530804.1 hypothetical protein [Streptomyces sp. ID05-39B]
MNQARRLLTSLSVNLLIGIPTAALVACARWYAEYGHCSYDDLGRPDLDQCTYDQIESSGFALFGLVASALVVVSLVVLFDVVKPLRAGHPLTHRLLTLPAALLPYALLMSAA